MNKTTTPRITLGMLKGACRGQRAIFRRAWPEGAEVTIENVRRAQELGLNLVWGEQWFTADAWKAYDAATAQGRKAYDAAVAHLLKVYLEATAPAREARDAATAPAWKAYAAAVAQAWNAYIEATAQALKAHREALAQVWVVAYLQSVAEREVAK